MTEPLRFLTLSGSLRQNSVDTALLRALAQSAPDHVQVEHFDGIRDLPLFNPDHEDEDFAALSAFRAALRYADAVVIACPEYAHGIPGAFKNALDWGVVSGEFDRKPTLLLCASARAQHAPAQLAEVLRTMGAGVRGPYSAEWYGWYDFPTFGEAIRLELLYMGGSPSSSPWLT